MRDPSPARLVSLCPMATMIHYTTTRQMSVFFGVNSRGIKEIIEAHGQRRKVEHLESALSELDKDLGRKSQWKNTIFAESLCRS